jgi:molybdopterin-guanine dinucleotide biosynthesis protein A
MDSTAIVLLAGGEARRFPGKLEFGVAGRPMLAHCYDRVRATGWPVFIAAKGSF